MRLGIDFGTTRTVVACSDRGNYPALSFQDESDNPVDWFPSVVAERGGELRFGFDALAVAADPAWTVLRSFKRLLSGPRSSPDFEVAIGGARMPGVELITRFLSALREAILTRSNRPSSAIGDDPLGLNRLPEVGTEIAATPGPELEATHRTPAARSPPHPYR